MNDLQKYFESNNGRRINKWMHYFDVYDRHLSRFRGTDVCVLEIGVSDGGSLQMWKEYFGDGAHIYGVDINPNCKKLEEGNIKILIGDQSNLQFLEQIKNTIPRIDVLIDDGGHFFDQQINTFKLLYPHISPHGIYICEDLHTSYWKKGYGGGLGRKGTFIEFSKKLIDQLNSWHYIEEKSVAEFAKSTHGIHYYDSVLVIEKKPRGKPKSRITGMEKVEEFSRVIPLTEKIKRRIQYLIGR